MRRGMAGSSGQGDLQRDDWGDPLRAKRAEHTRIALSNVNGLRPARWKNRKLEKLRAWMEEVEVDIVGLVELQMNWDKVHPRNHLSELLAGRVPMRTVQA